MISIRGQDLRLWLKNWRNLINSLTIHSLFISCLLISLFITQAVAENRQIKTGNRFPDLTFKDTIPKEVQAYLGLSRENNFSLNDIQGSLFIFEIFSTYCTSCPRNIPVLNTLYSIIEKDLSLKGKVKIIGIAIGNNKKEAEMFSKEHNVVYPLFTDYKFVTHKALGSPRVPYTIIVKKDAKGKGVIVDTHQGVIENVNEVICKIRSSL